VTYKYHLLSLSEQVRGGESSVVDAHYFGNLDPDLHPHQVDKPDTDPHPDPSIRVRINVMRIK
jgi:hypothetical protein